MLVLDYARMVAQHLGIVLGNRDSETIDGARTKATVHQPHHCDRQRRILNRVKENDFLLAAGVHLYLSPWLAAVDDARTK